MRISSLIVPNSWRTIDEYNNTVVIAARNLLGVGGAYEYTGMIVLRSGNYNINTLIGELNYQLNKASSWSPNMPPNNS